MEIILEKELEHQQKAVDAVSRVFDCVIIDEPKQFFQNPTIDLWDQTLSKNIFKIQEYNNVHFSMRGRTPTSKGINIDIKMETGTGKTYVYVKTIFELYKQTGANKFIVAVPSLSIKAGAEQFMSDPYVLRHFNDVCGYDTSIELCVVKPTKDKKGKKSFPSSVRNFVNGSCQIKNRIYILLVNINMLTSGKLLSRDDYDYGAQGFYRPLDAIAATKPIIIIDEPHRFSREQKAYKIIKEELKPQCIIRYGATFPMINEGKGKSKKTYKDYLNLLYDLDACSSFNLGLIKGVAKEHFESENTVNEKVKITSIIAKSSVTFNHKNNTTSQSYIMQVGDSLGVISEELSGLTVSGIGKGEVTFSNGQIKRTGEEFFVDIYADSYQEQMMRLAIQRHFETEKENFDRSSRIKTLALFFIDNIESYRGDSNKENAWLKDTFNELLRERILEELKGEISDEYRSYLEASLINIDGCSAAYFAKDNNDSDEAIAEEVDEILHNKKKLLSFKNEDGSWNVRRFLFSKWTLKEGWDNPNVFTIAKLRSSGSENTKLQEVGRGLRLPVDEWGTRVSNEEFLLNYIVDFTEKDFADRLIEQINGERPKELNDYISESEMKRVAEIRGKEEDSLMIELLTKKYIDIARRISSSRIVDFYEEYPEFSSGGLGAKKVIDRNKKGKNKVKIRKAQYEELKELWSAINRKYILFFSSEVDDLVEKALPKLLKKDIFVSQVVLSNRMIIETNKNEVELRDGTGVQYFVKGRKLPYNVFLKRINRDTSIPLKVLHKAFCDYIASDKKFNQNYFNESTITNFKKVFNEWKSENLGGKFNYKQTKYTSSSTALTKKDGSIREDVVQGNIGIHMANGIPDKRYLYDAMAYDSDLELENIKSDIKDVIVYGKIPRRSISIPTIANSSYSPDFMYVVRKANGEKELNIVVETKGVENKDILSRNEQTKIDCAEIFFKQLSLDGYTVHFKAQLNNKKMIEIVKELIE